MSNTKLSYIRFVFEVGVKEFSVQWNPKGSNHYSDYAASSDSEKNRKYEVQIFRGGGYKCSHYTDNAANKSNSIDYLNQYLKSNPS